MNWLDFVIIITITGFVFSGWATGLVREVVTLAAALVGVVAAGLLYERLAETVVVFVDNEDTAEAISILVLFWSVYLLGQIATVIMKGSLMLLMIGWWDKPGGAVFGFLKGLVVVQIMLIVFAAYPEIGMEEPVEESELASHFVDDWSLVLAVLPAEIEGRVDDFLAPQDPAPAE
jgi:membrane protein required for colicin V production